MSRKESNDNIKLTVFRGPHCFSICVQVDSGFRITLALSSLTREHGNQSQIKIQNHYGGCAWINVKYYINLNDKHSTNKNY